MISTSFLKRYWEYLSDRSYMAPMAFKKSDPIMTTTIPTFLIGSGTIIMFTGIFSFCHWVSYGRHEEKKNIVA